MLYLLFDPLRKKLKNNYPITYPLRNFKNKLYPTSDPLRKFEKKSLSASDPLRETFVGYRISDIGYNRHPQHCYIESFPSIRLTEFRLFHISRWDLCTGGRAVVFSFLSLVCTKNYTASKNLTA